MNSLKGKNIIISTHSLVYGAPQALLDYFLDRKTGSVGFIDHPLEDNHDSSKMLTSIGGYNVEYIRNSKNFGILGIDYLMHLFRSIWWPIKYRNGTIDLYIGVNPLNALAGIILKKIGIVHKVVFYTIDFSPVRFSNAVLNNLYHRIDTFCCKEADETWNVSPMINKGRMERSLIPVDIFKSHYVVPIGVWPEKVKKAEFNQIKRNQILFVGNLLEKQGVQLVIKALPKIKKIIPEVYLMIVGGGEYESNLKQLATDCNVNDMVTFTGWVKNRSQLDELMFDSAIAVATYDPTISSFSRYADPTKLKDYLSAGMPIVMTNVPHNSDDLQDHKCAMIVKYDIDDFIEKVVNILEDEYLLKQYRKNALKYIEGYSWRNIFSKNLKRVLK
jgi:glycosyltransferase involved in cell wall biosynthesis